MKMGKWERWGEIEKFLRATQQVREDGTLKKVITKMAVLGDHITVEFEDGTHLQGWLK